MLKMLNRGTLSTVNWIYILAKLNGSSQQQCAKCLHFWIIPNDMISQCFKIAFI